MGCWNATCFLTNLPITHRDPVRWFLVGRPIYDGTPQDGHCCPISVGYPGVYNDYGMPFETSDSSGSHAVDPLTAPGIALWQRWLDAGRLVLDPPPSEPLPKWKRASLDLQPYDSHTTPETLLYRCFRSCRSLPRIGEARAPQTRGGHLTTLVTRMKGATPEEAAVTLQEFREALDGLCDILTTHEVEGAMCHEFAAVEVARLGKLPDEWGCGTGIQSPAQWMRNYHDSAWWARDEEDGALAEVFYLSQGIRMLRRTWTPQTAHDGSQAAGFHLHAQFASKVAEFAAGRHREWTDGAK